MNEVELIGMFFMAVVPCVASVIALIKPILKFTEAMTKFNDNVDVLFKNDSEQKHRLDVHGDRLDDHEVRITKTEAELEHLKYCPVRNERS